LCWSESGEVANALLRDRHHRYRADCKAKKMIEMLLVLLLSMIAGALFGFMFN
jgi:hypothetical protein